VLYLLNTVLLFLLSLALQQFSLDLLDVLSSPHRLEFYQVKLALPVTQYTFLLESNMLILVSVLLELKYQR